MAFDTLERALALSSAQVASANRAACVRELYMDVRRTLMVTQDREFLKEERATTLDTLDCIHYHQELLMFGTEDLADRGTYRE